MSFSNQTWEPFYSIDIADEMAEAETRYLGSATLVDNHPTLIVDDLAAEAVAKLPTPRQRQLAIDFATNQRFRRDVFVRRQKSLRAGRGNVATSDGRHRQRRQSRRDQRKSQGAPWRDPFPG